MHSVKTDIIKGGNRKFNKNNWDFNTTLSSMNTVTRLKISTETGY